MMIFFGEPDCSQDASNKKKCYYTTRYKKWKIKKGDYRINWYALGGGVMWMSYRKMYSYTLYCLLACLCISTISDLYFFPNLSWLLYILIGFIGNSMYFTFAEKSILKIKQEKLELFLEKLKIKEAGGTSVMAMIICFLIFILLVGI